MSSDPPINALSFDIEDWFHMVEIESVDDPKTLMLQCGHRFHRPCLSKWLHTTLRMQGLDAGVVCPTCKQGGGACCAR